ncbi:DUF1816 domain-containing protein [Kamptonema formosum]|uniref:DUF1816 domain-containing protein n=1 Tax=Kamptonema formosum TaxID=331992 RepID=UPI00034CF88A|nr:DUF1816 domain-containing protein [Oscillatoria sp. PCC 10802]
MKELLISSLNTFGLAYWIEIVTETPHCTYYFGPFLTEQEALEAKPGYIEDLQQEGAQCVSVVTKRCQPRNLTVYDEVEETFKRRNLRNFSPQP